jgi:hypothetical protein
MTDMTPHEAIQYMFDTMEESAAYGASDTEPRAVFSGLLFDLLEGRDTDIPKTAEGWQLYSDMRGSKCTASILEECAKLALDACNSDLRGFRKAMKYFYGY